mgnify:CR=1 FL=1
MSAPLEQLTKAQLLDIARRRNISGRSRMTKAELIAAIAADGIPVYAWKGESLDDYWDYTHRIMEWHDGGTPNMILDDGGDATLLIMLGSSPEGSRPR